MNTLKVQRILFPTDGSECAAHAFPHALQFASATGAELHVVNVRIPNLQPDEEPSSPGKLMPSQPPPEVTVTEKALEGDSAAQEIIDYCESADIDLVVMGTHGRGGLGRLLLGSVAERVVREAPCPVFTVPGRAPSSAITGVLAAVDFSDQSPATLRHASAVASLFGARLHVVHVLQELIVPSAYGPDVVPIVTPQLERRTRDALEDLVKEVLGEAVDVECSVSIGYPASEILHLAKADGIELIAVSTHGLTGLQHFLIGSVAEKVVRKSPCPVLTVRSFAKSIVD